MAQKLDATKKAAGRPKKTSPSAKKTAPATKKIMTEKHEAAEVKPAVANGRKRKTETEQVDGNKEAPAKKAKTTNVQGRPMLKPKSVKEEAIINQRPSQRLNLYVFGEGSSSELGLGSGKNAIDVKRPRLNPLLASDKVGIVSVACGGMHSLALTQDGKLMSWGVNDNGALGRDTAWDGGLRDIDDDKSDDSDEDDDSGLNPHESTPGQVTGFPEDVNIVKAAAGDSISLALTDKGHVYGWGTFRNQSGILGFYQDPAGILRQASKGGKTDPDADLIMTQWKPHLYSELAQITDIACGNNHCMALSATGMIYIWGCGEQNQLGHHINERLDVDGKRCLVPSLLRTGRRKYKAIYTGADHAFAIDDKSRVWSWGLNSFGATGIAAGAGEDRASVYTPSLVTSLSSDPVNNPITFLCGGQHHSIAINKKGEALVFGRLDGLQTGLDIPSIPTDSIIYDDAEPPRPRILIHPTPLPAIGTHALSAAAGTDHSIVISDEGKAYSWGISVNYQTGQGTTEDIVTPTLIDNTAVREKKLVWAGCGGQFGMLASTAAAAATTS